MRSVYVTVLVTKCATPKVNVFVISATITPQGRLDVKVVGQGHLLRDGRQLNYLLMDC